MLSHDKEPGPTQETARSERMDQGGVGYKPSVSSSLAFMIEACVIEVFWGSRCVLEQVFGVKGVLETAYLVPQSLGIAMCGCRAKSRPGQPTESGMVIVWFSHVTTVPRTLS